MKSLLFLILVVLLSVSRLTPAQNSAQDFVDAHNSARAEVGLGTISWNDSAAAFAKNYGNRHIGDCHLVHSGGPYGENLFWGGGGGWTALDAVKGWVSEKQYYDYKTKTCAPGKECGHYTQVVWDLLEGIGCARVICNSGDIFVSCNYTPTWAEVIGRKN